MARKFEVGDKVRVRMDKVHKSERNYVEITCGRKRVGKVICVWPKDDYPYEIAFGNNTSDVFRARELELVKRKVKK